MKLLKPNSILKNLPLEMNGKQLVVLDSLRLCIEMIEYNFIELKDNLEKASLNNHKQNVPATLSHTWALIDHINRFVKTYKKVGASESNFTILLELEKITPIRNTIQHLDERIESSLLPNKFPFYGVVSWIHKDLGTLSVTTNCLVSGVNYGPQVKFDVKEEDTIVDSISHICLETVDRKKVVRYNI
jgi:hypothetical protein